MIKFNKIFYIVFDFLFPKQHKDKEAEDIDIETLSDKLLHTRETENKSIYALFDYRDDTIRNMIWSLKYRKNKKIAKIFAQIFYDFLMEEFADLKIYSNFENPILIPIPIHKKLRRKNGYNQTELLAKELYKIGDLFDSLQNKNLVKVKNTPHQTKLPRNKRLENIKGAFAVKNTEMIKNKNIVLLDDVTTTGATLKEAQKILIKAGAKKVIGITIAH